MPVSAIDIMAKDLNLSELQVRLMKHVHDGGRVEIRTGRKGPVWILVAPARTDGGIHG